MRAVVLDETGLHVADRPMPVAQHGEVIVRVVRAGLCETDLQLVRGYMGFHGILGHEFVGVATTGRYEGQRVVGEINCSCHVCPTCCSDRPTHCPHRSVLGILGRDGAFAEYVALPERNLHVVPDSVSDDEAVFVEPLAAAYEILEQVPHLEGQRVVVLGDGRLGQLCARVLYQANTILTVIGKHESKLQRLRDAGITAVTRENFKRDRDADVVVDCTGSASGFETALSLVRPRGTLVLKTTVAGKQTLSLAPIVIDEINIVGSRCGPFQPAIEALGKRKIDVLPLIDGSYRLDDAPQAFARASTEPVMKLLLTP